MEGEPAGSEEIAVAPPDATASGQAPSLFNALDIDLTSERKPPADTGRAQARAFFRLSTFPAPLPHAP